MKRTVIAEEGHDVNIIPPIDINGAGANSDVFSMKESAHVSILLQLGVTGAAVDVTLEECDDIVPTTQTAIPFRLYKEESAAGDTLDTGSDVAATGFSTSTNDNIMYRIEVDACDLSDDRPYLRLVLSDPAAATVVAASALLSGNRYSIAKTQIT